MQAGEVSPVLIYVLTPVILIVPLLTLGLVALFRARPEDIPAVIRALARWGGR
jgi:hypothetical protein